MKLNSSSKKFLGAGSVILASFSALALGGLNMIFSMFFAGPNVMSVITNDSMIWETWKEMPTPIFLKFRFFNITNPEAMAKGSTAVLKEMGPYTYREEWKKVDVTVSEESTLRYKMTKTYYFQPEMSEGSEQDVVTFINLVFLATASMANEYVEDKFIVQQMDQLLRDKGETLTKRATVKEIIFTGVPLKAYSDIFNNPVVQEMGIETGLDQDGTFALLKNRNGTDDGWFVIKTGEQNPMEAGAVVSYNGESALSYWRDATCNAMNGTDGTFFAKPITPQTVIQIFSPGMCRSISFVYKETTTTFGLSTLRFVSSPQNWMSPESNPDNWCFCPEKIPPVTQTAACNRDGIFPIASCADGAPLLLSQPHFFGSDDWIIESVEGLQPDFDKHQSIFDFHQGTGMLVQSAGRMQFSMELKPYPDMKSFAQVKHAVIPFAWIEESTTLDNAILAGLGMQDMIFSVVQMIPYPFIVLGVLLVGKGVMSMSQTKPVSSPVSPFKI